jgi:predicted RNA-binding protein
MDADKLHICFYTAPYGPVPADLSETYPLSQFEIATPLDLETMRQTTNTITNYVRLSGHKAVYLYRGKGELDDEVESDLMCACDDSKIKLTTIWSNDPWNIDAFANLANILKTRRPTFLE